MDTDKAREELADETLHPEAIHAIAEKHYNADDSSHIVGKIIEHPHTSEKTLRFLHDKLPESKGRYHYGASKIGVLAHPNAPQDLVNSEFEKINNAPETYREHHSDVALHPKIPEAKRRELANKIIPNIEHKDFETNYAAKHFVDRYSKDPSSKPDVAKYIAHPNKEVASKFVKSPHATTKDHKAYLKRDDLKLGDLEDFVDTKYGDKPRKLDPGLLKTIYQQAKDAPEPKDYSYHDNKDNVIKGIAHHPNTPEEVLHDIIGDKIEKEHYYHSHNARDNALTHPKIKDEFVHDLVMKGDKQAAAAATHRPNTKEETLRHIDSTIGPIKKYSGAGSLLNHPNYPEDLQLKRIAESTEGARAVMKNPNLSDSAIKTLLSHKNKNVAVDTLKEKYIKPEHVKFAYGRKAADVQRAASLHPLANDAMKNERVIADPVAATEALKDPNLDHDTIRKAYQTHGHDFRGGRDDPKMEFMRKLIDHKNLPPDVIHDLVKRQSEMGHNNDLAGYQSGYRAVKDDSELLPETKELLMKHSPSHFISNKNTTAPELQTFLDNHLGTENRRYNLHNILNDAHNLTPDIAKDIVSGRYGGDVSLNHGDNPFVKRPEVFNKDVALAAIQAPEEFQSHEMAKAAAASPHLEPADLEKQIADSEGKIKSMPARHGEIHAEEIRHHRDLITALLENPKHRPEFLKERLNTFLTNDKERDADTIIENPSLKEDDLKEFAKNLPHESGISSTVASSVANRLEKSPNRKELSDDILKNAKNGHLVNHLIAMEGSSRYQKDQPKPILSALENKDPQVLTSVLEQFHQDRDQQSKKQAGGAYSSRSRGGRGQRYSSDTFANIPKVEPEVQAKIDSFLDHENPEVMRAAYPVMSDAAQHKYVDRHGEEDPQVIKDMSKENLESFKIKPNTSGDVIQTVLDHPHATVKHFEDAIDHLKDPHSPIYDNSGAHDAYLTEQIAGKHILGRDEQAKLLMKLATEHPGKVNPQYLAQFKHPDVIKHVISRMGEEEYANQAANLLANDAVKSKDFDQLIDKIHQPEFKRAAVRLSGSDKVSTRLLSKIIQSHPDLIEQVARKNPKAAQPTIVKSILKHGTLKDHVALVKNDHVPEEIKDKLLENTDVAVMAKPEKLTDGQLDKLADRSEPHMLELVAEHPNTAATTIRKLVDRFAASDPKDEATHSDLYNYVGHTLSKQSLSRMPDFETTKKLLDKADGGSAIFKKMIDHTLAEEDEGSDKEKFGYHGSENAKTVNYMLDKHPDDMEIVEKLATRGGFGDEGIQNRLLDKLDIDQHPSSITSIAENPATKDKIIEKIWSKATSDKENPDVDGRSRIVNRLASKAPVGIQNEIVKDPNQHGQLLENRRLSKENYDKILNHEIQSGGLLPENMANHVVEMINHPVADSKSLDAIYGAMKPDEDFSGYRRIVKKLAEHEKASPEMLAKIIAAHPDMPEPYSNPNVSASTLAGVFVNGGDDAIAATAQNPKASLALLPNGLKKDNSAHQHFVDHYLNNHDANPADISHIHSVYAEPDGSFGMDEKIAEKVLTHIHTPEDVLRKMMASGKYDKSAFYQSPVIGGKLFREDPHPIDPVDSGKWEDASSTGRVHQKIPGLKPGLEKNTALYIPSQDKLNTVISQIPEGGHIEWATFKKEHPGLAANPVINKLFVTAPKQRLTKEHADKFMSDPARIPGSKQFHVSYTNWKGIQQHKEGGNEMVVQINNGPTMDEYFQKEPKLRQLFSVMQKGVFYDQHPSVQGQGLGWSRVDTSNPDHWFIDEIQSDIASVLAGDLYHYNKSGADPRFVGKFGVKHEDAPGVLNKMINLYQGWEQAALHHVIEMAKAHGVKKISIHSGKTKTNMNKSAGELVTDKYKKLYDTLPQSFGFQPGMYEDVPHHGDSFKMKSHPIWTLDLQHPVAAAANDLADKMEESDKKKGEKK